MALSERSWELRHLRQKARRIVREGQRYIDYSARFVPVERAEEGEGMLVGGAWVKELSQGIIEAGAQLDTLSFLWSAPANENESATFHYCASQRPPLDFGLDPRDPIRRFVCVGSMGSGKTEILARWIIRQAMRVRNSMIGCFAPTGKRRAIIYKKVRRLLMPDWITEIRTTEGEIELINGVVIKFVALKEYSKETGSPAAGLDLVAAGIDEEQDCPQEGLDEVEMRGRDAPGGYFPVLSTCTLKDTAEWRARKAEYEARDDCTVYRMVLTENAFVSLRFVENLKKSLSPRAYRMRVLALDAAPERATYPDFLRDKHVRPWPKVGVQDVTAQITGRPILIAHDPGKLWNVSVILKAFKTPESELPLWWIMGEVSTREKRLTRHIVEVTRYLADRWKTTSSEALVVADPYGNTKSEEQPDISVYKWWIKSGFKIRPAAYSRRNHTQPGYVPKNGGIEVVNMLLLNAEDQTRLYLDCDDRGIVRAKMTANAFEMSARDEKGDAETDKKDINDHSHWVAAVRYGVWPWEKARINETAWSKAG